MAKPTTLGALVDQHFAGLLCVESIAGMRIVITNDPPYDAKTFTVTAVGANPDRGHPLFGSAALVLRDIELTLAFDGAKQAASGSLRADLVVGGIDANVGIVLSKQTERFTVTSQLIRPVPLQDVLRQLAGQPPVLPPGLDRRVRVRQFAMEIAIGADGGRTARASGLLDAAWQVPLAGTAQPVSTSLAIGFAGQKTVKLVELGLTGTLGLPAAGRVDLSYAFGPRLSELRGRLACGRRPVQPADLMKLCGIGGGFPRSLGRLDGIDLAEAELVMDFAQPALQWAGRNSLGEAAFARVARVDGRWACAIGLATHPGWTMARMSPALKPVDDLVRLDQAYLVLTSADQTIDSAVFAPLGAHRFNVLAGLNVGAALRLDAGQASAVARSLHDLLGHDAHLFLQATLGTEPSAVLLRARFEADIQLRFALKGQAARAVLQVRDPELQLSLAPSFAVQGTVEFPGTDGPVGLTGGIDIRPGSVSFRAHSDLSMPPPRSAGGLALKGIGGSLSATPGALVLELDGDLFVGAKSAGFGLAVATPEMLPTYLSAQFDSLDLAPMFKALCRAGTLDPSLSSGIQFRDVLLWVCLGPTGCERSDGRSVPPGFAFAGQAVVFGFPAEAALTVTDQGMAGTLGMARSVGVKDVFWVSDDANPRQGPQFAFQTRRSPYLNARLRVNVLGISDSTRLRFSNEGFLLATTVAFKGRSIQVRCALGCRLGAGGPEYIVDFSGVGDFGKQGIVVRSDFPKVTVYRVSIGFSQHAQAFNAAITYRTGPLPKATKSVHVTLGEIGHQIARLGQQIEAAFQRLL